MTFRGVVSFLLYGAAFGVLAILLAGAADPFADGRPDTSVVIALIGAALSGAWHGYKDAVREGRTRGWGVVRGSLGGVALTGALFGAISWAHPWASQQPLEADVFVGLLAACIALFVVAEGIRRDRHRDMDRLFPIGALLMLGSLISYVAGFVALTHLVLPAAVVLVGASVLSEVAKTRDDHLPVTAP